METSISILCDNVVSRPGFVGEHGFSVLVERGNDRYLFDTGPGLSLPINLKALSKNLNALKGVLISHGHYDHTGGLKWVIEQTGHTEVVAHPRMFSRHMLLDPHDQAASPRYIGCPFAREELEGLGARFRFVESTTEVRPGIIYVTGVDADPGKRPTDDRLLELRDGQFLPDPVDDDASLLLETGSAPVLILGCAHLGVLNILDHVREKMGIRKLRAVLGGTHLMFYSPENVHRFIDTLEAFSIELVAVSHCSGMAAAIALANHFGTHFGDGSVGSVLSF
jgi:7,8-dihydropterin-6-yl-methyl-4-(beta-D-ribofuranosyl)aminobenzene 5'-phosphate synthase